MNKQGHFLVGAASLVGLKHLEIEGFENVINNIYTTDTYLAMVVFTLLFMFGSILPDYDYKFKHLYSKETPYWVYHRQITHSLVGFLGLGFYLYLNINNSDFFILGFALVGGVLTHLLADMITGTVPLWTHGNYNSKKLLTYRVGFKLFGKEGNKTLVKYTDLLGKILTIPLLISLFVV